MSDSQDEQRKHVNFAPDVAAILEDGTRREVDRHKTPQQRRQTRRDRQRHRMSVDMPPWLQDEVRAVAEAENAGPSSVVCWLVLQGLQAYKAGATPQKEIARSLKFDYDLLATPDALLPSDDAPPPDEPLK